MDAEVAGRVEDTYAETLGEQGFQLAPVPEEAYWSAFSMVRMSPRVDSVFSWSVYMMASQDLLGHVQAPIRFASVADDAAERSGYMLLKEVRLLELQAEVRQAAEATAFALLPHAARMCTAWETEPADQQSPSFRQVRSTGDLLEKLREELAREIIRMRRQRQQRIIEVELEPSS